MKGILSIFKEQDGLWSMRRVLAFACFLESSALYILCVVNKISDWKVYAACSIPLGVSVILLFFTTWADVAAIIKSIKGKE